MPPVWPEQDRGRLLWRCRRGMKELDLLLTGYVADCWATAAPSERVAFEAILELPDPVLVAYLMGRDAPPEPALQHLLELLRGRAAQRLAPAAPAAAPPGTP